MNVLLALDEYENYLFVFYASGSNIDEKQQSLESALFFNNYLLLLFALLRNIFHSEKCAQQKSMAKNCKHTQCVRAHGEKKNFR